MACNERGMNKELEGKDARSHWDIVLNPSFATGCDDHKVRKDQATDTFSSSARNPSPRPLSHPCLYCGRYFGQASNLNKHIRVVHLKLKPFSCKTCSKAFAQRSVAKNHFRSVHLGERPFNCTTCHKQFSDKSNLKKHIKLVHLKEKNHGCTLCLKRFGERRSLNDHVSSVHLKQKPHSCPVLGCSARFGQKSHLSTHQKSRHPLTQRNGKGGSREQTGSKPIQGGPPRDGTLRVGHRIALRR